MAKGSDRSAEKWFRGYLHDRCRELDITVPKNATTRQLKAAFNHGRNSAAIVNIENGVELRQTNMPTTEYTVGINIYVSRSVRAESEEAAIEWLKFEAQNCYRPIIGDIEDMGAAEIIYVYKHDLKPLFPPPPDEPSDKWRNAPLGASWKSTQHNMGSLNPL